MNELIRFAAVVCLSLAAMHARAEVEAGSNTASAPAAAEDTKQYGFYLGYGDPFPSVMGINAAYNINRDLRASIGYGSAQVTSSIDFSDTGVVEKTVRLDSYAAGIEYLFLPTEVRGVVGAHLGYLGISGDGSVNLQGFSKSGAFVYSNIGLDWLTQSGFELGGGMQVAYLGASGVGAYIHSGWFF